LITVVPGWFGADVTQFHVSMAAIAKSVATRLNGVNYSFRQK
jgi:hypothetical protein